MAPCPDHGSLPGDPSTIVQELRSPRGPHRVSADPSQPPAQGTPARFIKRKASRHGLQVGGLQGENGRQRPHLHQRARASGVSPPS